MSDTIVYYFSHSGNNAYIAKKIAEELNCEHEQIKPKPNSFFLLILMTFFNIGAGIKELKHNPAKYKRVILCSPIWVGHLVSPVRGFIKKYRESAKNIIYLTFCGSDEEDNKTKFGFGKVHATAVKLSNGSITSTEVLSVKDLRKNGKPLTDEELMSVKMDDELFTGKIKEKFDQIMQQIV